MHKNYEFFQADDFVTDDFFVQWVQDKDEESDAFWQHWQAEHPDHEQIIEEAATLVRLLQHPAEKGPMGGFYYSLKERIDKTVDKNDQRRQAESIRKKRLNFYLARIAASLLIVFLGAIATYVFLKPAPWTTYHTSYGEIKNVTLPDGSEVVLNANSSLSYRGDWNKQQRSVEVTGELLFDVRQLQEGGKRASFRVHHQDAYIEVLGTVFAVKGRGNAIRVALKEGSVRFFAEQQGEALNEQLSPGQVLYYDRELGRVEKKSANIERYLAWTRQELSFDGTPLGEVCKQLEEYLGISFIIQDPALGHEPIHGTLQVKNEQELLHTLSVLLNTPVSKSSEGVLIGDRQ